ncbi:MAG: proteasome component M29 [Alyxoria varia]|nr:MAG: proteasome component M29 [Alyxoria varia]
MAQNPSAEDRELELINKLEFRIALADSDEKLQSILDKFLCPLLLKLASEHTSVRNKTIAVCQQVNKRIAPGSIRLPLHALLKQFKENENSLCRQFDLFYVQRGFNALLSEDRAALVPDLISGFASTFAASNAHAATVFNLLLRSLQAFKFPPKGSTQDASLRTDLSVNEEDASFLATSISKLVLFRRGQSKDHTPPPQPGLSTGDVNFLTLEGKEDWSTTSDQELTLTRAKSTALKLLATGLFTREQRLIPSLFAAADVNSVLTDVGDDLLKDSLSSLNDQYSLPVEKLSNAYFGVTTSSSASNIPAVNVAVRTRILNVLAKAPELLDGQGLVRIVQRDLVYGEGQSIDRETSKLRGAVIALLVLVARQWKRERLQPVSEGLFGTLKDFLDQRYQNDGASGMRTLRIQAFEVFGLLVGANESALVEPQLSILKWLFGSLEDENDKEVAMSIDAAISNTIQTFQRQRINDHVREPLRELLSEVVENREASRNLKFAATRFANRCLPFDDVVGRWIDIQAFAFAPENDLALYEEGKHGLDPHWHDMFTNSVNGTNDVSGGSNATVKQAQQLRFPDFADLSSYVFGYKEWILRSSEAMAVAVSFLSQCLYVQCLVSGNVSLKFDTDWERKLDLLLSEDLPTRLTIRQGLGTMFDTASSSQFLVQYWKLAIAGLNAESANTRRSIANILLKFTTLSPRLFSQHTCKDYRTLMPAVWANDEEVRLRTAKCFGLIASQVGQGNDNDLKQSIATLLEKVQTWKTAVGGELNKVHGSIVSVAYFTSRRHYIHSHDSLVEQTMREFLPLLFDIFRNSSDVFLRNAVHIAIGQLCLFQLARIEDITKYMSIPGLLEQISKDAKKSNERAISALGFVSIILEEETNEDLLNLCFDEIRSLHEIRQPESHFTVGESLACLACAWDSKPLKSSFDVDGPQPRGPERSKMMQTVIGKVLDDCKASKPALKKAAVIWLLCLVQFCSERSEIANRLREIQLAFKRCLSSRDELVQESASRGLGLVYEKGNQELRDDLVRDLIGSFSGDKADMSGSVDADTQLFEPGALPTGDGSVSTYGDIMRLASDVGDPSLVYRFMSLASNNAIWSSRAAFGRFGLTNVLSDSQVDGYLAKNPKIYPKLFRYRFDPNNNVRKSMNDIWIALIKDPRSTIDTHFELILNDLLQSMVSGKDWRARQSSCAALADLIQERKLYQLKDHVQRMWSLCYKVLDDIKESVRAAALALAKTLESMLLRNLETKGGNAITIESILGQILDILLSTSGLESRAEENQAISLHTLLEIVKKGNANTLRPFIPHLIERLLGLLSTMESAMVNYAHMNASKYNLQEQDIDNARLNSIRSSPFMEAMERCIDMLDEDTMAKLKPRLLDAFHSAVGVPSKMAYSRVLVSLSTRRNFMFRPYADAFLAAFEKRMLDRNTTVSSSYAAAMGYIARSASDSQILRTANYTKKLYFDSEEDRARIVSADIVHSIAKSATDRFNSFGAEFLPFVFLGRHDDDAKVKKEFHETWDETTGGQRAVTLYLKEIVGLCQQHISSRRWTMKHAAALSISDAVNALVKTRGSVSDTDGKELWPVLKIALSEKTWDGKSHVLEAFVAFVEKARQFWTSNDEVDKAIVQIALREARRKNLQYQTPALSCLGRIMRSTHKSDLFEPVFDIAGPIVKEHSEASPDKRDSKDEELDEKG